MAMKARCGAGWSRFFLGALALAACLAFGPTAARCNQPAPGTPGRGDVVRFDPETRQLVPVPANELKTGNVYNFFSPSLNRRVWSILQANGQFWHALGEGTSLPARQFDLRISLTEGMERIKAANPDLAYEITSTGMGLYLQLGPDAGWKLGGSGSVPQIYDLETRLRWEYRWNQYIPISHTYGYLWGVRDGKYVPAGSGSY